MISFSVEEGHIELGEYSVDSTLADLAKELDAFRVEQGSQVRECYACGECCRDPVPVLGYDVRRIIEEAGGASLDEHLSFPAKPDIAERAKSIVDMVRQHGLSDLEATLIYEYNRSEPVTMAKHDGACYRLRDNLCSIHDGRYFICELFFCRLGERLSGLFDSIVSQGVWHSYVVLDWIPAVVVEHNPFLKADSYDQLILSDFDVDLEKAAEKLFFYF